MTVRFPVAWLNIVQRQFDCIMAGVWFVVALIVIIVVSSKRWTLPKGGGDE